MAEQTDEMFVTPDMHAKGGDCRTEERLVNLLEFEIKRADGQASRSGFTRWTLTASVAGILWLLTYQLEDISFAWTEVGAAFVGLAVLPTFYLAVNVLLSSRAKHTQEEPGRFLLINPMLSTSRLYLAYGVLRDIAMIGVSAMLALSHHSYGIVILTILYTLSCLIGVISLTVSFLPFPIPVPLTSMKSHAFGAKLGAFAMIVLILGGLIALLRTAYMGEGTIPMSAWRVGGAILVVVMLLDWIIRNQTATHWSMDTLLAIHHDLLLGQLNLEDAWDQYEMSMSGTTVRGVFQVDMEAILRLQRELASEYSLALEDFQRREEMIAQANGCGHTKEEICKTCAKSLESTKSHCFAAEKTAEQLIILLRRFSQRARLFRWLAPSAASEIEALGNRLAATQQTVSRKLQHLREHTTSLSCPACDSSEDT